MSYDEELEFLRKEFKKSEAKFHEAEREGWHTDSNIYEDNMANLGYQIHIHEQAAKADEYEAKAKAFDKYHATISSHLHLKSEPEFSSPPTEVLSDIIDIHNEYESGEYDY